MLIKRSLLCSTALAALLALSATRDSALAQSVAYPNFSLGGLGGAWQGSGLGLAEGRLTIPVGPLGAQVDGYAGSVGGSAFWQVSGQVFLRNPSSHLLALYGAATHQQGTTTYRVGPEAELYLNNITLSGVGGWKFTSSGSAGGFLQAKLSLYLTPDTKLFGGYIFDGSSFGNVGFEHRFASSPLAIFGEARFGSAASGAWIGIRGYFGGPPTKTLIDRDRKDVAPLWLHLTAEDQLRTTEGPPLSTPQQTTPSQTTPSQTTPSQTTPPPTFTTPHPV